MLGPDLLETTSAAAADGARRLTTKEKVKADLDITATTWDTLIDQYIDQVSDDAARYCDLAADTAGAFPTFGAETLRATWFAYGESRDDALLLPWRPKLAVTSVVENGVTLAAGTDYRLDAGGELRRLCDSIPVAWDPCYTVVVAFTAGWSLPTGVPAALEARVIDQVKLSYASRKREPGLRAMAIEGIGSETYSVAGGSSIGESGLLVSLESALGPYRHQAV